MTLNPVFRSEEAIKFLSENKYLEKLLPSLNLQVATRQAISDLIYCHFHPQFHGKIETRDLRAILEKDFFLILFSEVYRTIGSRKREMSWYAKFNYCIRSRVTLADNLFDDEDKTTLPFSDRIAGKFRAKTEEIATEELFRRLGRYEPAVLHYDSIKKELDNKMLRIGKLEGSEENGVKRILKPAEMIAKVHRIRGGALFELGMIAPKYIEPEKGELWLRGSSALNDIGTAFQIVDDVVDFEFDLKRKSNNIVVAEIYHNGSIGEKQVLNGIRHTDCVMEELLEKYFPLSARRAVERAYAIARKGFVKLQNLGFWYNPSHAEQFVNAILGEKGTQRLEEILEG